MEIIINIINNYAPVPVLLVGAYTLFIFQSLVRELKIFSVFIFLSVLIQIISSFLWFKSINNLPLLHIYVAVGFVSISWFYSAILQDFINKRLIWGTAILFTAFTIINSTFFQPPYTFNSYALTVQAILIIILSLSTFLLLLNDIVKGKRMHLIGSINWINSGLFIYYTSSILIFYFGDYFTRTFPVFLNQYTWALHAVFSMLMYGCFFIGLWKRPKEQGYV